MHGAPGRIQFTSILSLLVLSIGSYFGYALLPAYTENYTLKQDLSGVANQGWHKLGRDELQKEVIAKAAAIGSHVEIPPSGLPVIVKGLPIGEDEVSVTCTDSARDCTGDDGSVLITATYVRIVTLPYLSGKYLTLHFSPSATQSLQPVEW